MHVPPSCWRHSVSAEGQRPSALHVSTPFAPRHGQVRVSPGMHSVHMQVSPPALGGLHTLVPMRPFSH